MECTDSKPSNFEPLLDDPANSAAWGLDTGGMCNMTSSEWRKPMPKKKNKSSLTEIQEAMDQLYREGKVFKRHDPVRGVVYFLVPEEFNGATETDSSEWEKDCAPYLKTIH
jgi:hypothetical protein